MVGEVAIALGAAAFLAVGFVVQQHAAADEPPDERLSLRLLLHLARRPLWLLGVASMIIGQLLGALAFARGTLALVEPMLAANLIFALPLSAVWHGRRLGGREWIGAVALVAGLAAFVAAGDPRGGSAVHVSWVSIGIALGLIAFVSGTLVATSTRASAVRQAMLLACAAGVLYGLQDAITERLTGLMAHGIATAVVSWAAIVLIAVAVVGMIVGQSAFEAAPLDASLPAITMSEPITGTAIGVGIYGEHLDLAAPFLGLEVAGFTVMIAGVYLVASSPIVTGQHL